MRVGRAVLVGFAIGGPLDGQGARLDELRTPASPAFVLLGVAPSAVERPTSPKTLGVSVVSAAVARGATLLPRDYGLEVAPYWLAARPGLTLERYYHPSLVQSLLQSLALSVAGASLAAPADSIPPGTAVGIGMRTALVAGRASPEMRDAIARLRDVQQRRVREIALGTARAAVADSLEREAKTIARDLAALDAERVGWTVELAGALVADFPRDLVDSGTISRTGAWLTAAYRALHPAVDLVGVARYLRDARGAPERDLLDVGARLGVRSSVLAASAEFVAHAGPRAGGAAPGYRLAAVLEARVERGLYLTAAFGKDGARLVSQIGLTLGLGAPELR